MASLVCPRCAFENARDASFCENCGRALTFKCFNCGEPLTFGARFCRYCGAPQPVSRPPTSSFESKTNREVEPPARGDLNRLSALHQNVPTDLARKILSTRGEIEGQRKQVTVLFTDIVNSTGLAERMDPEQWAAIVNGAHRLVTDRVFRFEGTVAQLLGDGVLCFFGAPISHENDPERGMRAALGIMEAIPDYAEEVAEKYGVGDLRLRIGLNTGLVVVGNVGTSLHFEYLALGDTVNLAARLQVEADPNSILVSENTYRLVSHLFDFQDRGQIEVKGKSVPVHAYKVIGDHPGLNKSRRMTGLWSPLVGREREFATLNRLAEDVARGTGAVLTVLGEAGIGKSRLLAEWKKRVIEKMEAEGQDRAQQTSNRTSHGIGPRATGRAIRWAEGRSPSFGVSVAYSLVVDLMRSLLGVPSGLPEDEDRAQLQHRLVDLFATDTSLFEEVYPFLAQLLSLPLELHQAERVKYLDVPALQKRYVTAAQKALQLLAQDTPTVLVCEDLHWADPFSIELLGSLLPLVAELPLLICLVARPDHDNPGWRLIREAREMPGVGAIEIHLASLAEGDSRKLVSNLMQGEIAPSVRDLILGRAEGNPFFVEEVIGVLIDRGIMQRRGSNWVATSEIHQIEIPQTILGVLMARVDELPEEARQTLQVASVIGRTFSFEILANVLRRQEMRTAQA